MSSVAALASPRSAPRADVPGGRHLAEAVIAVSVAREQKRSVVDVASEMFRNSPATIAIARSAVGSADTSTAGWAAELVRSETKALQEALIPISALAGLSAGGLAVEFAGADHVTVATFAAGTTPAGAWIGEGGAFPVVKAAIGSTRLNRFKAGGLLPLTKELELTSTPGAIEAMRRLLLGYIGNLHDATLFDNVAEVTGIRPAGLLNGVTPIAATSGGGVAAASADIKALIAALPAGARPALLMNPGTAMSLELLAGGILSAVVVIPTPFLAASTVVAVDLASFVSALDPPEIDLSGHASLVMADASGTAPTHAGASAGGGAIGTATRVPVDGGIPVAGGTGASVVGAVAASLWQSWSIGVRLAAPMSFGTSRAGAVQQVTSTTW